MFQIKVTASEETYQMGCKLGDLLSVGMIIALNGPLGAGKTLLTRGIARGLEVVDAVSSPTFTLIQEYQGRLPLYHFDFYRLDRPQELENLGYEEYLYGDGVCVIEWAEKFSYMLPSDILEISISKNGDNPEERFLKFSSPGDEYKQLMEVLKNNASTGD